MEKILPLIRGLCPVCGIKIMDDKFSKYTELGTEVKIHFTDGTKADFGICVNCKSTLTKEQADKILQSQKINWGIEIQKTLSWYIAEAVHLKTDRWE